MSFESGAYQVRRCQNAMQECVVPIGMAYFGLRPEQVFEKLVSTELRETCGYVQTGELRASVGDNFVE